MAFRVKDLMINIAPGEGGAPGGVLSRFPCNCGCTYGYTVGCPNTGGGGGNPHQFMIPGGGILSRFPCNCGCTYGYTVGCGETLGGGGGNPHQLMMDWCPPLTILCTWTTCLIVPIGGDPALAAEQLAALKSQLQQALTDIENQEKIVNDSLQPQTVAQVEELQTKLRSALADLDRRKSELEKK
jgi:hypothetical protein